MVGLVGAEFTSMSSCFLRLLAPAGISSAIILRHCQELLRFNLDDSSTELGTSDSPLPGTLAKLRAGFSPHACGLCSSKELSSAGCLFTQAAKRLFSLASCISGPRVVNLHAKVHSLYNDMITITEL